MTRILEFPRRPFPFLLDCSVQHYDWGERGAKAFIPRLLGTPAVSGRAYAELWIGAHPLKPSQIKSGPPLDEFIRRYPVEILGPEVAKKFNNRLPFLMKVLSAAQALSIQAHPNLSQAKAGFAREDALRIPRDAASRNYKDDNHKPELLIALTPFYALNRFRPIGEIRRMLDRWPELKAALPGKSKSISEIYRSIMTLDPAKADSILSARISRLASLHRSKPFLKKQLEYWVLKADREYSAGGRKDKGLFSMYLLNFAALKPGEAFYLDAGELHAYLEGVGVEVMANSDNVLRGGLTPKHVDVPELLKTLTFKSGHPRILRPDARGAYRTPVLEFEISALRLAKGKRSMKSSMESVSVILCVEGKAELSTPGGALILSKGTIAGVPAILRQYALRSLTQSSQFYICTVSTIKGK